MSVTGTGLGYRTVRIGLRAPRAAVVFDGGADWCFWARLALYAASNHWGGCGFMLVPHVGGAVDPLLLQAVRAYDPDYVVCLQTTVGQHEQVRPGHLPLRLDGKELVGSERARVVDQIRDDTVRDLAGAQARDAVAEVCSPYRRLDASGGDPDEHATLIDTRASIAAGSPPGFRVPFATLTPLSALAGVERTGLSAPRDWGGPLGVMVAARCGLAEEPTAGEDPPLDPAELRQLVDWLIGRDRLYATGPPSAVAPDPAAAGVDLGRLPLVFDHSTRGLTWVGRGVRERDVLVVVGDSASDFAAAWAWNVLYGSGVWLPSVLSPAASDDTGRMVRLLLGGSLVGDAIQEGRKVVVSSVSVPAEHLEPVAEALRDPVVRIIGPDGGDETGNYGDAVEVQRPSFGREGLRHLAVVDQFDESHALPVMHSEADGITLAAPPPVPALNHPELEREALLGWQVDLQFWPPGMPTGRGLDGHVLFAQEDDRFVTWVRSGRDGISYESHRFDFVAAGTPRLSQLARPRVRELGLAEWCQEIVKPQGKSIRPSPAGLRSEVLQRLCGGRVELTALMSGPLLPVLQAFNPTESTTSEAYPDSEGVVLLTGAREGYLTFAGVTRFRRSGAKSDEEFRHEIDRLLTLNIMRRGLVIDCATCERPSFVAIDDLRQTNTCRRCGAYSELVQQRWRQPYEEPCWYYDLHPVARELLADNGDVPLLLSAYLRARSRHYTDISELELHEIATNKRLAEADLVAISEDVVMLAEAKSNTSLGSGAALVRRAAAKRVQLAAALRADQIVLATTQREWTPATLGAIATAVRGHTWPCESAPTIRIITSLGTPTVQDHRMEPSTLELRDL